MRNPLLLLIVSLGLLAAFSASAVDYAIIDYVGFAWEDGGIPSSNPGDVLAFTAVATGIDAIFGVDLQSEEVTVYVYGLVSLGEVPSPPFTYISFSGGNIEVYADPLNDHDWGTFPPNPQLGTFTNGTLLLSGMFTSFDLALDGNVSGNFQGFIDGVGGTVASACTGCEFTFGGAFGRDIAQVPDGYDLQIDGQLYVDEAVSTEETSFGAVKALY